LFRKTVSSLILFGVCCTPVVALAQQHDDNHQNDNNYHQNDNHQNDNHQNGNNFHQNDNHQNDNRNGNHQNYVHHNEWKHGYHMPQQDWNRGQRVDYRTYHLSAPPRGYEWREVDGNYVMAAVTTGVIASVIAASAR
jgi:Ni/Co efflux regulator RcnB